jgi:predicted secreted protein
MRTKSATAFRLNVALTAACVMGLATSSTTPAQSLPGAPQVAPPTITVTGAATTSVPNDRLQAWLRADADNASAAMAASQVNAAIARALSDAKAFPSVKVSTAGYSTQQINDKGKPTRWRVSQGITLDATDFTAAATLISKLQDDDGLLLSSMAFSLTDKTRREAEDSATQQAIRSWQARAQLAANGFGFAGWHPSHITVQTGDGGRVYAAMRSQAAGAAYASAAQPVALEAGNTDVTVNVSGDAVLDPIATPTR